MGKYYVTTEFLYRSITKIQADSADKAKEILEKMPMKEIVGKKKIDIDELEDGIVVAIDEEL